MEVDKPIAIAVILFLVLVASIYLVLPKYHRFQNLLTETGTKQAEFEGKDAYFIEVTRVYKQLTQYQESLDKIEIAVPKELSLAELINLMGVIAAENGIVLKSATVSGTEEIGKDTGVKATTIGVSLTGTYKQFKNFLSAIEKSTRLIEGQTFSFNVSLPEPGSRLKEVSYPISLTVKAYSY